MTGAILADELPNTTGAAGKISTFRGLPCGDPQACPPFGQSRPTLKEAPWWKLPGDRAYALRGGNGEASGGTCANRKLAVAMLQLYAGKTLARRAWLALVLMLVGVASCNRNETAPLRIGVNPWPGYELFFLADKLNYFAEEGVDVRLVEQVSLKDTRRVYGRGLVDGMLGTPMDLEAINARQNRPAMAFCALSYSSGGDAIVARGKIRNVSELRGKRVAIEQGLGDYFLTRALESAGMTCDDVTVVYLPYPVAEEALREGKVDAIHTFTPILRRLTQDEGRSFQAIFTSRDTPAEIVDLLIVDPDVAAVRASELVRLERAYDRACLFLKEHPDRAFEIMAAREGVSSEEMARAFQEDLTLIPPVDRAEYLSPTGSATLARARYRKLFESESARPGRPVPASGPHTNRHASGPELNP